MTQNYKIAVLPGDGIGEEVTSEALKVLEATGFSFEAIKCNIGGSAYLKKGDPLPPESMEICEEADAVLFGAVGHDYVSFDIPRKVLIYLRLEKDAFANIRPLKTYPGIQLGQGKNYDKNIDMVIVRDNAEGFSLQHSGLLGKSLGTDRRVITQYGANRIIDFAFKYATKYDRIKITCVDQSNWLYSDKFFRSIFEGVSNRYAALKKELMHVDVAALMLASQPEAFDIIVTPDIYGDILSGIVISMIGGIGMAPSACIGEKFAFFEPIHGTAWDIAGKGIANPIASILSAKLMLEWLGQEEEAQVIDNAVSTVLEKGEIRTPDIGGHSRTSEVGNAIASCIA